MKLAIIDRILKAVIDDNKSITPENLIILSNIVNSFDAFEKYTVEKDNIDIENKNIEHIVEDGV